MTGQQTIRTLVDKAADERKNRHLDVAMQILQKALMNHGDSGMLYVEIAKVHRDKNELCEMEAVIGKASQLLQDSPYQFESLVIKAEALVEIGKKDPNSCERVEEGLAYFR